MNKLTLFLLTVIFFSSCDKVPKGARRLYMVNNSDQRVVYLISLSYPDTVSFIFDGCSTKDIGHIMESGESKIYRMYGSWEEVLNEIPSKTLMFFVYNADAAGWIADNKIGCDSLRKRPDLILKRFDVTVDYLNANNWELVYP